MLPFHRQPSNIYALFALVLPGRSSVRVTSGKGLETNTAASELPGVERCEKHESRMLISLFAQPSPLAMRPWLLRDHVLPARTGAQQGH